MKLGLPHRPPLPVWIVVPAAIVALAAGGCGSSGTPGGGGATSGGPVSLQTRNGPPGTFLTDQAGRSLYLFAADTAGQSTCSGACASAWPPLRTNGTVNAGNGVTAGGITTIKRGDGAEQVVYQGHPLYYFAGDGGTGQTNGQGSTAFGNRWWLVTPAGQPLTTGASPSAGGSPTRGY